jgi:hypothetical protein
MLRSFREELLYPNILFDISSAQDTLMAHLEHIHLQVDSTQCIAPKKL